MDSKDIQLISSLQKKIIQWLSYYNSISYSNLYEGCQELIRQESLIRKQNLPKTLFYSIVFPLVKVGIIEYGISNDKNTEFFLPLYNTEYSLIRRDINNASRFSLISIDRDKLKKSGINILKSLPSIQSYIESLDIEPVISEFNYVYDASYRTLKKITSPIERQLGIYKEKNLVYFPYYLVDIKGNTHKLPSHRTCLECMDYAHSYIRSASGEKCFEYSEREQSVRFFQQSHVPPFVMRAMCMIYPDILMKDDIYIGNSVAFHTSDKSIVKELTRIFKVKK